MGSQACARIRFSHEVTQSDVAEAMRLMKEAKHSTLRQEDIERDFEDEMSRIYGYIRTYLETRKVDEAQIADLRMMPWIRRWKRMRRMMFGIFLQMGKHSRSYRHSYILTFCFISYYLINQLKHETILTHLLQ